MDIYEDLKKVAALPYRWDKLAGSRIAISGGTGFLGSALIGVFNIRNALYNDDIRVVSLSRSGKKRDDGAPNAVSYTTYWERTICCAWRRKNRPSVFYWRPAWKFTAAVRRGP